jgi:hypothetical protein
MRMAVISLQHTIGCRMTVHAARVRKHLGNLAKNGARALGRRTTFQSCKSSTFLKKLRLSIAQTIDCGFWPALLAQQVRKIVRSAHQRVSAHRTATPETLALVHHREHLMGLPLRARRAGWAAAGAQNSEPRQARRAISVLVGEIRVLKHFQKRMPYGLFVPWGIFGGS